MGGLLRVAEALGQLLGLKRGLPVVLAVEESVLAAEEAAPLAVLLGVAPAVVGRALLLPCRADPEAQAVAVAEAQAEAGRVGEGESAVV